MKSSRVVLSLSLFAILPKIGMVDFSMLLIFLLACYNFLLKHRRSKLNIPKPINLINFFWVMLFALALISFLYHGKYSIGLMLKPVRQIVILTSIYVVLFYSRLTKDNIMEVILYAGALNAFVVIAQYVTGLFIPGNTGDFLMHPDYNRDVNLAWRKPGLMLGYPHSGVLSAYGVLSGIYLLRHKYTLLKCISFSLCFIGLFLSARTGLMLGLLGILILLPLFIYSSRKNLFVTVMFFCAIIGGFTYVVINGIIQKSTFTMMFEVFINLLNNSDTTSASQTALFESFTYPIDNISTVFIGNGEPHHADNLKNVDSGFQQYFFGGGIFYMATTYYLFLYTALISVKRFGKNKFYSITVFLMFLFLFIAAFKGGFIYSRGPSDLLLIIFAFSLLMTRRSYNG
jgi:hypothetical protein